MAYVTAQARQELLDAIAEAVDDLGVALAALGEAYEALDEQTGDRLEEQLFRPAQAAYGRARRTHSEFAARHGLPGRAFQPAPASAGGHDVRTLVEEAVDATADADDRLVTLQDSMMPVEVGDAELRAGLAEVRRLAGEIPLHAQHFLRSLGR